MTEPTDVDLWEIHVALTGHDKDPIEFARAVLAKWGNQAQAADSVLEDAARYRWLREGNDAKHGAAWHVAVNLYGCEWDAAIDAAMNKGATQ